MSGAPKMPKGAKKAGKKAGMVKKLLMVGVLAGVGTAITMGLLMVFGALSVFPEAIEVPSLGAELGPLAVATGVLFPLFATLGVVYVFFQQQVVESTQQTIEIFGSLPAIGKGLVVGIPFGAVVGLSTLLVGISVKQGAITLVALLVAAAVAWLVFAVFVFQHLRRGRPLTQGVKILLIALAAGMVLTIATGFLDNVAGLNLPWYSYVVVLGVVIPATLVLVAPEYYNERGGVLSEVSRKSGFAQKRQVQGTMIAAAIGFVVALVLATIVNLIVDGLLIPTLSFVAFWIVGTVGAMKWFKSRSYARLDLVITDIRNRSSGDRRRELEIRNEGNRSVDLRDAKIRDTEGDLFQTSLQVVLAPGQKTTFNIPPAFALATTEANVNVGSWSISRSNPVPVIVTREGAKYELWMEEEKHRRVRERKARENRRKDEDLDDKIERKTGIDKVEKATGLDIDIDERKVERDESKRKGKRRGRRGRNRDKGRGRRKD